MNTFSMLYSYYSNIGGSKCRSKVKIKLNIFHMWKYVIHIKNARSLWSWAVLVLTIISNDFIFFFNLVLIVSLPVSKYLLFLLNTYFYYYNYYFLRKAKKSKTTLPPKSALPKCYNGIEMPILKPLWLREREKFLWGKMWSWLDSFDLQLLLLCLHGDNPWDQYKKEYAYETYRW